MPTNLMCHVLLIPKGAMPFPKHKQKGSLFWEWKQRSLGRWCLEGEEGEETEGRM